jgi:hypothetical protein
MAEVDARSEFPEVIRVLSHNDPVFCDGAREHKVIGLTEPAAIARMNRVVEAGLVKMAAERGRDALVDEKPHAALLVRREMGRPSCGWVLP